MPRVRGDVMPRTVVVGGFKYVLTRDGEAAEGWAGARLPLV